VTGVAKIEFLGKENDQTIHRYHLPNYQPSPDFGITGLSDLSMKNEFGYLNKSIIKCRENILHSSS
jgi:hypothetical protein